MCVLLCVPCLESGPRESCLVCPRPAGGLCYLPGSDRLPLADSPVSEMAALLLFCPRVLPVFLSNTLRLPPVRQVPEGRLSQEEVPVGGSPGSVSTSFS